MSRQENRNREEKQQKKNSNKHALTSLAPPTEQIPLPAALTAYFFLAASFHAKCRRSDFVLPLNNCGKPFALRIPEEL